MTKLSREGDITDSDRSLFLLGGDRIGGSPLSPEHANPHFRSQKIPHSFCMLSVLVVVPLSHPECHSFNSAEGFLELL